MLGRMGRGDGAVAAKPPLQHQPLQDVAKKEKFLWPNKISLVFVRATNKVPVIHFPLRHGKWEGSVEQTTLYDLLIVSLL